MTPTFTFAGVYLRVAGDQVIWPVEVVIMSPHHGNVTGLITLSPPPLCSQFPIIHLIRWWRQGDTSHWGSCITNPTNTPRKTLLCSETCLDFRPISLRLWISIDLNLYWLQPPILNWRVWVWAAPVSEELWMGRIRLSQERGPPKLGRPSLQSLVTGDAQLWPNFWCQAQSLQCGLENIMTFLLWTVISRTINGWFGLLLIFRTAGQSLWNIYSFSQVFSFILWSCVTTEAEITEPSHLDLSPSLCSVHIDCKQLEMFYFNQLDSTSQIKTLDWDQGDIPQDINSPLNCFPWLRLKN